MSHSVTQMYLQKKKKHNNIKIKIVVKINLQKKIAQIELPYQFLTCLI